MRERFQVINRDVYLEKLRSELIDPKPYRFEGAYFFQGRDNFQEGSLEVDRNGKIAGFIVDPNSVCDKHIVESTIENKDNFTIIKFVKLPTGILVPIHYLLAKPVDGNFEGDYKGMWHFKEAALELKTNKIAKETQNQATLKLFKA